jgi:AcrR family transcriptional regulator
VGLNNVSTGSFYWHFKNKEQLFDAVVREHYEHILQMYEVSFSDFFKQSNEEQLHHMGDIGSEHQAAVKPLYQDLLQDSGTLTAEWLQLAERIYQISTRKRFCRYIQ